MKKLSNTETELKQSVAYKKGGYLGKIFSQNRFPCDVIQWGVI